MPVTCRGISAEVYRPAGRLAWLAVFGVASAAMARVTTIAVFGIVVRIFPDFETRAVTGEWLALASVMLSA